MLLNVSHCLIDEAMDVCMLVELLSVALESSMKLPPAGIPAFTPSLDPVPAAAAEGPIMIK